jgi:ABC-type glycerol-3-phosphate transport system substrate-binding protein
MNAGRNSTAFRALATAATALSLSLTACAPGGNTNTEEAEPTDVSTRVPSRSVTLDLAYTDTPPTQELIDGFVSTHPNVTINAQQTAFSDYIKSITRSMATDNAPDIAQYNPGAMRSLIPAGLVLDLGAYAEAYGWEQKFPQSSLEVLSSDKSAQKFGTGKLYAAPGALSVLGVFYNKALLADAGVKSTPTTLDDFEAAMDAVAKNGGQPLSVGGLQVGGFHLWNALLNGLGDVQQYRDWVYGVEGSTIQTPAAKEAAETITRWVSKGYITEAANATADSDAQANFTEGKSAFLITGNWAASAISDAMGDDVGFFLMPGAGNGTTVASGASVAYSISSKSEEQDVAAAFLDYLSSPEAAAIQLETGFMPVDTEAPASVEGLHKDIVGGFSQVVADNGIVPFPDFAAPGMIDRLTAGVQGLISKRTSPDEFLASLQEEWDSYHG